MGTINKQTDTIISFKAKLFKIDPWTLLVLPKSASIKLPSRGMTMVDGTINGFPFKAPLEPDGKGSHWLKVDEAMLKATQTDVNDTVSLEIKTSKDWPEPKIPEDLSSELTASADVRGLWLAITPMARWDWIRWIGSTKQPETRRRRIEVAFSKLKAGEKRPCCFNRTMCTDPYVSNNGVLLNLS